MRRILTLVLVIAASLPAAGPAASAQAQTSSEGFSDVPGDHPRKLDIDYAAARGWFEGFEDGAFRPDQVVSSSQIAALVGRVFAEVSEEGVDRLEAALFMQHGDLALSSPTAASVAPPTFSDFPPPGGHEGHEAVDASVAYAAARGWFVGYPDGTFRPYRVISAGQVAAVVGRAFADGVSRAEMAAFLRHGNLAVVAHEASLAWDHAGDAFADAQAAWEEGCADFAAGMMNPEGLSAMSEGAAALLAEVAAGEATAEAWKADAAFWETLADRGEAEDDALAKAEAAAAAWEAALAAERKVYAILTAGGDIQAAVAAALEVRTAETAAWAATADATRAAAAAESRAEESVREAWAAALEKMDDAVAARGSLTTESVAQLAEDCPQWIAAWGAWKDWAAAMSTANDALAAVA